MKRSLLLAILVFVGASAQAEESSEGRSELSTHGEFRLRYQVDQDADMNSKAKPSSENTWKHRFKLDNTFRSGEKFTGHLSLIHNSTWGNFSASNSELGTPDGVGSTDNLVLVNQAYGSWMASDELMFRFGRSHFKMADGSVISENEWEPVPTAIDGGWVHYDTEFAHFAAWGAKLIDYGTSVGTDKDRELNMYGLSVDVKALPELFKIANIHVIKLNRDLVNGTPTTASKLDGLRYGLTVAGDVSGFDFRGTYAMDTGETTDATNTKVDVKGSMMDLEAGYTLAEVMNLRFFAGFHQDSGDEKNSTKEDGHYDPFLYELHENAGLMDVVHWGNLTYMQAGVTLSPVEDMTVGLTWLDFSRTSGDDAMVGTSVHNKTFTAANNNKEKLGSEYDLYVDKKYDGGFSIRARYGRFEPGDAFKAEGKKDSHAQYFLEGRMTF